MISKETEEGLRRIAAYFGAPLPEFRERALVEFADPERAVQEALQWLRSPAKDSTPPEDCRGI